MAATRSLDLRPAVDSGRPAGLPRSPVLDLDRLPARLVLLGMLAAVLGVCAALARVGSDADWLAALGHVIGHRHHVPAGVPFAASPTGGWANPLVLAELIFAELQSTAGARGLMLAQLIAAGAGLTLLARDARRGGAQPIGIAAALGLVALGASAALAIARVQLFSLVLFPALIALLRAETRQPSRRIWLAVPLLTLWANLHGVVLLGLGALLAHLLLGRGRQRPIQSAAVATAGIAALWLTPALAATGSYYAGLLTNEAAQQGQGMWGPLSVTDPLDLLLVLAALVLATKAVRAGLSLWEAALAVGLAVLTIRADRDGVWLLLLLAPPAARRLSPARSLRALALPAGAAGLALLAVALHRGPVPMPGSTLVPRAVALAHGRPVLADGSLDEEVALAGGRIWAGNPIDAFSHRVQDAYLAWLAGGPNGTRAVAGADVVLVTRGTREAWRMGRTPGFTVAGVTPGAVLYRRVGAPR